MFKNINQFAKPNRKKEDLDVGWQLPAAECCNRPQTNKPDKVIIFFFRSLHLALSVPFTGPRITSGHKRTSLICVSHDNRTAVTDKISCKNLTQAVTGSIAVVRQRLFIDTSRKKYTVSINEATGCLFSFHSEEAEHRCCLSGQPLRKEVIEAQISCFHCG